MVGWLLGAEGAKTIGAVNDQIHEVGHYFVLDDTRLEELMAQ